MTLKILAIEPYLARSHEQFLTGLAGFSRHEWRVDSLPARKWKWRMRSAAIHFVERLRSGSHPEPDLIFASDYLNLAEFVALLPESHREIPTLLYFHENQLTYPVPPNDRVDYHFALTHYYAMRVARAVVFNSEFHRESFTSALKDLLEQIPDVNGLSGWASIEKKSRVFPLGLDQTRGSPSQPREVPVIAWNQRWEYDRNPREFLEACLTLKRRGIPFRLKLFGVRFRETPPEFDLLKALDDELIWNEFVGDHDAYLGELSRADIVVSTSIHEFFGLGTLEAIRAGLLPVLPRRLAYPELIPPELSPNPMLLYSDGELVSALATAVEVVQSGTMTREREQLVNYTDRFSWERLTPQYDALIEELVDRAD